MDVKPHTCGELAATACQALGRTIAAIAVHAGNAGRTLSRDRRRIGGQISETSATARRHAAALERLRPFESIPFLGPMLTARDRERLASARETRGRAKRSLSLVDRRLASARRLETRCREVAGALETSALDARRLGSPPAPLAGSIRAASRRAIAIAEARDRRRIADVLAAADGILRAISGWRRAAAERAVLPAAPAIATTPAPRIFLPIPLAMERDALRLGCRIDPSVTGSSRVFVTPEDDLGPLARMLPLAYRAGGARLRFPPIPAMAARHNVWSLFDRDTWTRLRLSAYEGAGRRCMICGGRGGFFARRVLGGGARAGVDCHETWNWTVQDPATGVGLQRLDRLLTVCVDCHMMFHEGFAATRARDAGLEDEVRARIAERRALVNQMEEPALAELLEADRAAWQATDGIDTWVVDLGRLSSVATVGTDPVFIVDNAAGIPPERIGGLAFTTDDGRAFAARPAEELLALEMRRTEENSSARPRGP